MPSALAAVALRPALALPAVAVAAPAVPAAPGCAAVTLGAGKNVRGVPQLQPQQAAASTSMKPATAAEDRMRRSMAWGGTVEEDSAEAQAGNKIAST
mmetsp:Transcript_93951/g.261540  ORF Transcript_93951/g.261540 Transcript_93951/m.261540 type:complete len:97 (-) Transcript_93951:7-297(-)